MSRESFDEVFNYVCNLKRVEGMRGYGEGGLKIESIEVMIRGMDNLITLAKKAKTSYNRELKKAGGSKNE